MTDQEFIFKLMHAAFLDIRIASYSNDCHTCFVLSDVFHNVQLQLNQAERGKMNYSEIVTFIHKKCEQRNCKTWLDNAITNISNLP